jgi:hypothetical protein
MRLYLAAVEGITNLSIFDDIVKPAFLVSYWYVLQGKAMRVVDYANDKGIPLFLDSGAFSAMTLGASIDLQSYITFCREQGSRFSVIASLDVIGDWRATAENHDRMRQAGISSIPAFHVREPFEALERLLEENTYIALGVGGMQRRRNAMMAWLAKCFKLQERYAPQTRYHGFAITGTIPVVSFPWYSVDSSTWFGARRFGVIIFPNGNNIRSVDRGNRERERANLQKVPRDVFISRHPSCQEYEILLRYNAKTMLEWIQSIRGGQDA